MGTTDSILLAYEEGFVPAYIKCHCFGIVAYFDVIFGLCCVSVFNNIREMSLKKPSVNRGIMFSFFNDAYKRACEEYRLLLCKQLGISLANTYWVADRIGDLLDVNCYYVIDMDSLKFVVDSEMTFDEFDEWYENKLHVHLDCYKKQ